ncbi:DUF3850 domain-containing protein [Bradyrhizobium sp. Arg68]|uniref:DUF3850 domain-containing protein n=1 Tax=Bradyrhizobium ivorense TaxID=2511166 RepID=UPI00355763B2|nr:DUF3850 domain-containing protein [Bradyrhizobium ivorense]
MISLTESETSNCLRTGVEHTLKCWPEFFVAIKQGRKKHDLRRSNDRRFQVGDTLLLCEFDPRTNNYTDRTQRVLVTYVTSTELPCALSRDALHRDFCILSIEPI